MPLTFIGINLLIFLHKPFSIGPDRAIHDPAVNRIIDPSYLLDDWIVGSIVNSSVHFFLRQVDILLRIFRNRKISLGRLDLFFIFAGLNFFIYQDLKIL